MNNHTRMYTNYSKITIPKKYNDNNKTAFFLHTRVSSSRWYTANCFIPGGETFYGIPLILPLIFGTNALYWANTILGECNIGRIQYWANTILGECDSPLQLPPRIRTGVSHTPLYIHPKLHYYNITCNVFWVGSLVWLSHQNINSLPNNYSQKKSPCPTANLGYGGFDV